MIQRREVALGGLLTILFGSSHACCQSASASTGRVGCMLSDQEARVLLSRAGAGQVFVTGNEPVVARSGSRNFDYALAQTLSHMGKTLDVLPGFAYYDDYDAKNAYATTLRRFASPDGTVLFGLRLLEETRAEAENSDIAVTAVCAHEFGHILQYKRKIQTTLFDGTSTKKRLELHADFLAGFYAGMRKLEKPRYNAAVFAVKQRSLGDNNTEDVEHHGTPAERAKAVVRGFETAYRERRSLNDAIQIGIQYVST